MDTRAGAPGPAPEERGGARDRGTGELDIALAADLGAAGAARSLLKLKVGRCLSAEERFVVELLVSELVNNAVLHGGAAATGKVGLRVDVGHGRIRVEVREAGLGFRRVEPDLFPGVHGGFGLTLVNDLASRWDVDVTDGTCVWFELDRGDITSPPERAG